MKKPANSIMGPAVCQGCGTFVWWARGWTRDNWNGPQIPSWLGWRERTGALHKCDGTKLRFRNHRHQTRVLPDGRRVWA